MPTHIDSLAQVYARSLFELAEQAGGQEKILEVGDELEQIGELIRSDRSVQEFLRSPIVDTKSRGGAINGAFGDKITDLTLRFLLVLNEKGRLGHLEPITAAYDRMVQEAFGRIEVDVYTSIPLEADQLESIKTRIQEALSKEPVVYAYTDPKMIGGIKLRIGDRLIDASVATRLRRMRDQLRAGSNPSFRDRLGSMIEEELT